MIKVIIVKFDEYFDDELKATAVHMILGTIAGYASFVLNTTTMGLLFALIAGGAGYAFSVHYLKMEAGKWYGSAFVLLLSWLITWTLFYNIALR